ncbi:MAG: menaquinone biosynthesis protein [Acidobacteriota bacterium]
MSASLAAGARLRVCAVNYLNTVPLVWGMLHGSQRGLFELIFRLPSECAQMLESGEVDVGLVPSIEARRLELEMIRGAGIASRGPVRSILLVSKVAPGAIRTLAADSGSRTSVALAQIVLAERYGAFPEVTPMPPELPSMLEAADAALIIGDPALRLDPPALPFLVLDLGAEWTEMTGLPMVFAVWAGRRERLTPEVAPAFLESCRFGLAHIEDIVRQEAPRRGIDEALARRYLTRHMVLELGEEEYRGLERFLACARDLAARRAEV